MSPAASPSPTPTRAILIKPDNKVWAALQGDTLHQLSIWAVIGMIAILARCST
jgi:formate dehydrogenase subunit gamma